MSYMKIPNLYKDTRILEFSNVYAMEKVHGTSAHILYRRTPVIANIKNDETGKSYDINGIADGLVFFSGGASHEQFVKLFGPPDGLEALTNTSKFPILQKFRETFPESVDPTLNVTVYGEAYGGKMQGMKDTYGPDLRFIVFEVKVMDTWLDVPNAEDVAKKLGLEFVPYWRVSSDQGTLDKIRDMPSEVALRRGITEPRIMEGIVLRPPFEVKTNNGSRLIAKYKRPEFSERASKADASPEAKEARLAGEEAAREWVTLERMSHVLMAVGLERDVKNTGYFIDAMMKDIELEAGPEVEFTKETRKAIARLAATIFKKGLA